jgi:transcriptional regulator with XRE-family HTH domain
MLLDEAEATARMIGAGRMLAGLDQRGLAHNSEVSASTISNIETGKTTGKTKARRENLEEIEKALLRSGVTLINDNLNGRILLSITYKVPGPIDIMSFVRDPEKDPVE